MGISECSSQSFSDRYLAALPAEVAPLGGYPTPPERPRPAHLVSLRSGRRAWSRTQDRERFSDRKSAPGVRSRLREGHCSGTPQIREPRWRTTSAFHRTDSAQEEDWTGSRQRSTAPASVWHEEIPRLAACADGSDRFSSCKGDVAIQRPRLARSLPRRRSPRL